MITHRQLGSVTIGVALVGIALVLSGCAAIETGLPSSYPGGGKSPLHPARPSKGSVALEIFWARYPLDSSEFDSTLWMEVNESRLPPALRRRLAQNGLRAGVVGNRVPDVLADVLNLRQGTRGETSSEVDQDQEDQLASLLSESTVTRQRRQLPPNIRWELVASETIPQVPLLLADHGELNGQTFHDAQAVYAIEHRLEPDGRVQLQLTPELQYGPAKMRYKGSDGILRPTPTRDRRVFSKLQIEVSLAAGEMLIITGIPDASSRLGHYFHTVDGESGREQKLIVIRLAQVPESQAFGE